VGTGITRLKMFKYVGMMVIFHFVQSDIIFQLQPLDWLTITGKFWV